jgi:SAM-dependent methyltransferase
MSAKSSKPGQWAAKYAQMFKDQSVVDDYYLRPPYVPETFRILGALVQELRPRRVLDAGCGTGNLARQLIHIADHVDAVDFSAAAIEQGKRLPGGDDPRLNWLCSPMETANLAPGYALITAGSSLHWMEWETVVPAFKRLLLPGGSLALVENVIQSPPWSDEINPLIARYSMNKEFQRYDNRTLAGDLQRLHLFHLEGERQTTTVKFGQTIRDYVSSFHSRNGLARDRLGPDVTRDFDDQLTALVTTYCPSGDMTLSMYSRIIWGYPLAAGN